MRASLSNWVASTSPTLSASSVSEMWPGMRGSRGPCLTSGGTRRSIGEQGHLDHGDLEEYESEYFGEAPKASPDMGSDDDPVGEGTEEAAAAASRCTGVPSGPGAEEAAARAAVWPRRRLQRPSATGAASGSTPGRGGGRVDGGRWPGQPARCLPPAAPSGKDSLAFVSAKGPDGEFMWELADRVFEFLRPAEPSALHGTAQRFGHFSF